MNAIYQSLNDTLFTNTLNAVSSSLKGAINKLSSIAQHSYTRGVGTPPDWCGTPPTPSTQGWENKSGLCYSLPNAGWAVTSPGFIGILCPSGSADTGTTCHYDRGVGVLPNKQPCAPGLRDDGTSCWEDVKCSTVDRGYWNPSWGCGTDWVKCWDGRIGCYNDCYRTWISNLQTTCSGCGCIKTTLMQRQSCPSDRPDAQAGLCYPAPKSGFNCTLTSCDMSKQVKSSIGTSPQCKTGLENKGGLCYTPCSSGYTGVGAICVANS